MDDSTASVMQVPNQQPVLTEPSNNLDKIAQVAKKLFLCAYAGVSKIEQGNEVVQTSLEFPYKTIPLQNSFSKLVIDARKETAVQDAGSDPRFANFALVAQDPKIRFFAGVPVIDSQKNVSGVLWIMDVSPRNFDANSMSLLTSLAPWAASEMSAQSSLPQNVDNKVESIQNELSARSRELAVTQATQEAMLDNIGDGIIGTNDRGLIIYTNAQTTNLTGFAQNELMGKMLIHALVLANEKGEEIPISKRPSRLAIFEKRKVVDRSGYFLRKDKTKFAASITATPVLLYGQVIGGVIVFRDISHEKEIDRMKTEFISLASHQLRTPLSAMKWFAEMLLDGDAGSLTKEQSDLIDNMYKSNERMIALVNALLNISRIESGRIIIEPKPTNIEQLLQEVLQELQQKIAVKRHVVLSHVEEALPSINIDPKLIRHVYMNLLTNAIKYTPEGGQIDVTIKKSGNEIISTVKDNGYGIPESQKSRIFEKFFRAENILKHETDGTGLGLYLAKAIVEASGGKIWFESEEGKGTTFSFVLSVTGSKAQKGEVSIDS